jgi:hypothetical protein
MIEINLLPEEMRQKDSVKFMLPDLPIRRTLIQLAIVVGAAQLLLVLAALFVSMQGKAAARDVAALKVELKETITQKARTQFFKKRLGDVRAATTRTFNWASLLSELTKSVTKGVWLRSLSVAAPDTKPGATPTSSDRMLRLEGSVLAPGQEAAFVGKFIKELKANTLFTDLFSEIKLQSMNQKRIKENDVYDFVLICKFKDGKLT